mgnify:CR=1 FL=1
MLQRRMPLWMRAEEGPLEEPMLCGPGQCVSVLLGSGALGLGAEALGEKLRSRSIAMDLAGGVCALAFLLSPAPPPLLSWGGCNSHLSWDGWCWVCSCCLGNCVSTVPDCFCDHGEAPTVCAVTVSGMGWPSSGGLFRTSHGRRQPGVSHWHAQRHGLSADFQFCGEHILEDLCLFVTAMHTFHNANILLC